MSYDLEFLPSALKEWRKLDPTTQLHLKKKLEERLLNPRVPSAQLKGAANRYKIKLRSAGWRIVYEVRDERLVVIVIAVGKRERGEAYALAAGRGSP